MREIFGLPSAVAMGSFIAGPMGGIAGGTAAITQTLARSSPEFASKTAQVISKAGNIKIPSIVDKIASQAIGQSGVRAGAELLGTPQGINISQNQQDTQKLDHISDSILPEEEAVKQMTGIEKQISDDGLWENVAGQWIPTREHLKLLAVQDFQQTGGKNLAKIEALGKFIGTEAEATELSDTAIKNVADLQGGIEDIASLREVIQSSGTQTGPIVGKLRFSPYASDKRNLQAEVDRVRQVVGKALEGGVLRKEDEEKYKKILPTLDDTETVALSKLNQLYEKLKTPKNPILSDFF